MRPRFILSSPFKTAAPDDQQRSSSRSLLSPPSTPNGSFSIRYNVGGGGKQLHPSQQSWPPGTGGGDDRITKKKGRVQLNIVREITAVALWWALSSSMLYWTNSQSDSGSNASGSISQLYGWILAALRFPATSNRQVSSSFVSIFLLLRIHSYTKVWPNLGVRLCELRMKRIGQWDFACIFLVHLSTIAIMHLLLSIATSQQEGIWKLTMFNALEVFAATAFAVSLLVVPILLKMNRLPPLLVLLILNPILMMSSSSSSLLSPQSSLSMNTLLGGWIAGEIMTLYFPDDPKP